MTDFLCEQIPVIKTQITAVNAAVLYLLNNPHKSYQLDTGQSSQRVTRDDIDMLNKQVDILSNRLVELELRCNGGGTIQAIPGESAYSGL